MVDIRKIIIIFVVAILFSVLVFDVIEAAYPRPNYDDFCRFKGPSRAEPIGLVKYTSGCSVLEVPKEEQTTCEDTKGYIEFQYDSNGCPTSYECNTCSNEWDIANQNYSQYVFYISAVLALIAIFVGMYLPAKENSLNEWVGTGFMLGGVFALFFGTIQSFHFLDRIMRPIIISLELALIIFMAYKKMGNLREDKKKDS